MKYLSYNSIRDIDEEDSQIFNMLLKYEQQYREKARGNADIEEDMDEPGAGVFDDPVYLENQQRLSGTG